MSNDEQVATPPAQSTASSSSTAPAAADRLLQLPDIGPLADLVTFNIRNGTIEEFTQDLMWHKAGRPVSLTLKKNLAISESVREMLVSAGCGSAAARLPAEELEVRRARSYLALFSTVKPLLETFNGSLDYSILTAAVAALDLFPLSESTPDPTPDLPEGIPANIRSRAELVRYIERICANNAEETAYAFGFYTALAESQQMMGGTATAGSASLLYSYALKRLKNNYFGSYYMGFSGYQDYAAYKQRMKMEGKFNAPNP